MRPLVFCFFIFLYNICLSQQTKKVVLVIADGIPADVMEKLRPPDLMNIARQGFFKRAYVGGKKGTYKETPTISAPGYNDMLTGTWAYKHNVWDNDNQKPNFHYPTIFRLLKTYRPDANMAIFSTWVENRKMLLGADLPATDSLHLNEVFDGYEKDKVAFPHDRNSFYLHQIDDHVVQAADSVIRKTAPDLSWIYLEYTDDVGHSRGTGTAFDSAVFYLDHQMKKIYDAIHFRESHYNEDWLLVITTDHGRDSITGKNHGGQSKRERTTWMITNQKESNEYLKKNEPAIVDILPTVAQFMSLPVSTSVRNELDGVPFLGDVSISDLSLHADGDQLKLTWLNYGSSDSVSIFISYTNNYKSGGIDKYNFEGKTEAGHKKFEANIPGLSNRSFYKIVVQGKYNTLNVWKQN
jgi:hypothetical protein